MSRFVQKLNKKNFFLAHIFIKKYLEIIWNLHHATNEKFLTALFRHDL